MHKKIDKRCVISVDLYFCHILSTGSTCVCCEALQSRGQKALCDWLRVVFSHLSDVTELLQLFDSPVCEVRERESAHRKQPTPIRG